MQQYDQQAGLDVSSLPSVSQSQLLQMINQSAPLSNIGFVLCFAGDAAGAAGVGFPDVTNNPRFIRYIWIDTQNPLSPSIKKYSGTYAGTPANPSAMSNLYTDWVSLTVSPLTEIISYPYLIDNTRTLNHATKYIEYSNTISFPAILQGKIKCISADLDYSVGDEVSAENIQGQYPGVIFSGFTLMRFINGLNYTVRLAWGSMATLDLLLMRKDSSAVVAIDKTKWAPILYTYL